ncbi:tyrosine-protein phosphatase [Hydrogenimonas sp.]
MEGDDEVDRFMKESYRTFCVDFRDEVRRFFTLLLDEAALPLAFHCTAGKDRTGILAALFLFGLGVSKKDIIADYMESNRRINAKEISQKMDEFLKADASGHQLCDERTVQKLGMFFEMRRSWIEAFIEGTNECFGSIESYLQDEIMLDTEALRYIY